MSQPPFILFSLWLESPSGPRSLHCSGFEITFNQTHHTREDSSGRLISPTQITLLDNTQHSQQKDLHAPSGIRNRDRPHTPHLRPHGHRDRLLYIVFTPFLYMLNGKKSLDITGSRHVMSVSRITIIHEQSTTH